MQTKPTTDPTLPAPSGLVARLRSALRGDKYMVDAYPTADVTADAPPVAPDDPARER
jgi:hypothetical protein